MGNTSKSSKINIHCCGIGNRRIMYRYIIESTKISRSFCITQTIAYGETLVYICADVSPRFMLYLWLHLYNFYHLSFSLDLDLI